MKETKFRYVFKKPNGHIVKYFTDIQHLEHGEINDFLQLNFLSIERDLISRDLYTGRNDKNNIEIYEGDLIFISKTSMRPAEVYFDERSAQFRMRVNGNMQYDKTYDVVLFGTNNKIIGNIFENPKLLEATNEKTN